MTVFPKLDPSRYFERVLGTWSMSLSLSRSKVKST